jgi:hypothetical protein
MIPPLVTPVTLVTLPVEANPHTPFNPALSGQTRRKKMKQRHPATSSRGSNVEPEDNMMTIQERQAIRKDEFPSEKRIEG